MEETGPSPKQQMALDQGLSCWFPKCPCFPIYSPSEAHMCTWMGKGESSIRIHSPWQDKFRTI